MKKKKKKKKKKTNIGYLVTFWFSNFAMLFTALGVLLIIEDVWYIVYVGMLTLLTL